MKQQNTSDSNGNNNGRLVLARKLKEIEKKSIQVCYTEDKVTRECVDALIAHLRMLRYRIFEFIIHEVSTNKELRRKMDTFYREVWVRRPVPTASNKARVDWTVKTEEEIESLSYQVFGKMNRSSMIRLVVLFYAWHCGLVEFK